MLDLNIPASVSSESNTPFWTLFGGYQVMQDTDAQRLMILCSFPQNCLSSKSFGTERQSLINKDGLALETRLVDPHSAEGYKLNQTVSQHISNTTLCSSASKSNTNQRNCCVLSKALLEKCCSNTFIFFKPS
jgi:hypothetical protein